MLHMSRFATHVVWSIATVAGPKLIGKTEQASAPISPHEITVKHGKILPVESWDAY